MCSFFEARLCARMVLHAMSDTQPPTTKVGVSSGVVVPSALISSIVSVLIGTLTFAVTIGRMQAEQDNLKTTVEKNAIRAEAFQARMEEKFDRMNDKLTDVQTRTARIEGDRFSVNLSKPH